MVDNNGFVVISEDPVHTGKFFGEVDGTILESLVKNDIFRQIKIYDYQVSDRWEGPSIIYDVGNLSKLFEHNFWMVPEKSKLNTKLPVVTLVL